MLNQLSMTRKLLFTLVPMSVLVLLGTTLFARGMVREATTQEAISATRQLARAQGEQIVGDLLQDLASVRALASVLHTRNRIQPDQRRDFINQVFARYLADHTEILGVWTVWEPNAFDGLDAQFVNAAGHDATGRFIPYWYRDGGRMASEPLKDYDTPGAGDYYLLAKTSRHPVILEPYKYAVGGVEKLLTSLVIPVIEDDRSVGVVGVDLLVSDLQEQVAKIRPFEGVSALFGQQGGIIAHPDPARLGLNLRDTESDVFGDELPQFTAAVLQGQAFMTQRQTSLHAGQALLISEAIPLGDAPGAWSLAMMLPLENVLANTDTLIQRVIFINLVGLALLVALILVLSRSLATPLRGAVAALEDIASGQGDLTRRLPVEGRDEMAHIAAAFNTFVGKIQDLIGQLTGVAAQLAAAAEELFATSESSDSQMQRQRAESEQVATAMHEMTATVQEVARHANDAARAAEIANQESASGSDVVQQTIGAIESLVREIEEAGEIIHRLETDSGAIGKVLDVIRGIAEQTNLLALNAAIEAARAGEQGRGFAVVADEVRVLASRTEASTKEIQQMIERLQAGADNAVGAMALSRSRSTETVTQAAHAGTSLKTIGGAIARINEMNIQIASAAEEQSAVAEEINRNVANISQSVDSSSYGSRQIAEASEQLARLAAELQTQLGQFKV